MIVLAFIIWILLFLLVFFSGSFILESSRKHAIKKWKMEERDYAYEKWEFRLYVIAFFVGIPILVMIALMQELHG